MGSWWLWCLVFGTFNLPVAGFLAAVPFGKRLNKALKEKSPDGSASDATSYSRVTGALGAVVLTAFFWAIGNVVLDLALTNVGELSPLLSAVGPFFLVGSALFLPYAFNQLKTLFPWTANAAVAMTQMNQGAALAAASAPPPWVGPAPARLVVANLSSIGDAELATAIAAIQVQVDRDFKAEWGLTTLLSAQRTTLTGPQVRLDAVNEAIIYLGDMAQDPSTGVDGLLGHHAATNDGASFGFVFLDACAARGEAWSVILSHEVLELLADPQAVARVVGPDPKHPGAPQVSFEFEICDPTDSDSYPIGTVRVANFVTQRYFGRPGRSGSTNCRGLPLAPFSARPGGYAQYHDGVGLQILDGDMVTAGQLGARAMMGAGRRNARRANATSPALQQRG